MNKEIVISTKTIFLILLLSVSVYLFYLISDILFMLLISVVFSLSAEPYINSLNKKGLPRWVAVGIVFSIFIGFFSMFLTFALPVVATQTTRLIESIPTFVNSIIKSNELKASLNNSLSDLTIASGGVFTITLGLFNNILSVLSVFVFTLYISLDLPHTKKKLLSFLPQERQQVAWEIISSIESSLGNWIKGQAVLMLAVGLASYIGLLVLNVPYALSLALIAGILEVVPVLGPIVSAVIFCIVGFAVSPVMGFLVLILSILIQQLENNFLVPKIMQKVIGFNPLVTMLALLIGAKVFGVAGALISLPVALSISVITSKLLQDTHKPDSV